MATNYEQARQELDAILAGLMTEKRNNQSDKKIITAVNNGRYSSQNPIVKEKQKLAAKKRSENTDWIEYMSNRATVDPNWHALIQEKNRRKAADPEFRAKLKEAKAKYNDDPVYRRKLREARAKYVGDPEYHAKLKKAAQARVQTKEWREKNTKHRKPVLTPYGIFDSLNSASETLFEKGHLTTTSVTPMAAIKLKIKWNIKKFPNEWKFISLEEYIMLTGKDPFNG